MHLFVSQLYIINSNLRCYENLDFILTAGRFITREYLSFLIEEVIVVPLYVLLKNIMLFLLMPLLPHLS